MRGEVEESMKKVNMERGINWWYSNHREDGRLLGSSMVSSLHYNMRGELTLVMERVP